ncbi:hypothetical protein [Erwinia psidii]|uniref:Uncharacterized protein n=1 Tax=Erwinia psidii TaxID=69224 RepID=A0A3N6RWN7_9GAMM|nr:hypothetical protein [Erwinia psidii]MCX8957140.1 hypothetical protein [Erwinia psidii]MCX8961792.1 hypothetical protein [Erwinia psidii]MCX8965386.1 hypothetical protein [Erwinia psidii]RQM37488.1 hypothetical protein EB241_14625 [Erwinia psidii]
MVANAGMPQLFALAREYCVRPMFNALMRAQSSLAWVLGPPVAFGVTAAAGFTTMYPASTGIFTVTKRNFIRQLKQKTIFREGGFDRASHGRTKTLKSKHSKA